MLKIKIDKKDVLVPEGATILDAAKKVGVHIPTLCYLNLPHYGVENRLGGCRVCVVEVEGRKNLAPACATDCVDGMVIHTTNIRVLNARKTVLRLILSDHPKDCLSCAKSGDCDLQSLSIKMGIRSIPEQKFAKMSQYKSDISKSIIREMDKCISCRRCETMCTKVQTVGALSAINRGFESVVATAFEKPLSKSVCTFCGQCVAVCPTGALTTSDHTNDIIRHLASGEKIVVVQTAPAVRTSLGETFGMGLGVDVTKKMVTALRELGFNYVFDTDFGADLTIMEEAAELVDRVSRSLAGDKNVKLPMLTSCCPAWVNFIETYYSDMLDIPSTARSPQQMFGAIAKTYFADKIGVKREDMIVVSIMPCLAKKYECSREEFSVNGNPDVDYSISTVEFAQLIKVANINLPDLEDGEFDKVMGESSGAGAIFGASGGVIEAAARTAYKTLTGSEYDKIEFEELRGFEGLRVAELDINGLKLNIGIAHGLGNARKILDKVRAKELDLHAIEIMACPGGCVGGGGQPPHHGDERVLQRRKEVLYSIDKGKANRQSHNNLEIQQLYKDFLGKPLGAESHKHLHTHYYKKH